jgi:hypothetical protein
VNRHIGGYGELHTDGHGRQLDNRRFENRQPWGNRRLEDLWLRNQRLKNLHLENWYTDRTGECAAARRAVSDAGWAAVQCAVRGREANPHTVGTQMGCAAAWGAVGTAGRATPRGTTRHSVRTVECMVSQRTIGIDRRAAARHAIRMNRLADAD